MVAIDYATAFMVTLLVSTVTTNYMKSFVSGQDIIRFGDHRKLISDHGCGMTSKKFQQFLHTQRIDH